MKSLKICTLLLVILSLACVWFTGQLRAQDAAAQTQYEQAVQAAQAGDFEGAYKLAERLALRNPLFYPARLLRIALAAQLKKSGPEDPQNLLRVLKGDAPLGTNPERDLDELRNRLASPAAPAAKPPISISPYIRQKRALVIGIGNFKDPKINGLRYTTNDARAFAEVLRHQCQFDAVELLLDETATTSAIKRSVDKLARESTAEDLAVVYVAGHGSPENLDQGGINYIITYDTEVDSLYATAYEMNDLLNDIERRIPAERVIAFIDTCYSGATFKERPKIWVGGSRDFGLPQAPRPELLKDRLTNASKGVTVRPPGTENRGRPQGIGRVIIASSRQDQKAWESGQLQHGYFTYYLLEALRRPTAVSIQELYEFLSTEVPAAVRRSNSGPQNPTMVASLTSPVEIYLKEVSVVPPNKRKGD